MRDSYRKYRVHLLERLKVDHTGKSVGAAEAGNGQRPVQLLLLLLLLGAIALITFLVVLCFLIDNIHSSSAYTQSSRAKNWGKNNHDSSMLALPIAEV